MSKYIIGIDQSTQGTKALLFDEQGNLMGRADLPHRQIVNEKGWVEHDPEEILANLPKVVKTLLHEQKVSQTEVVGIGISNQRETGMAWNRRTGKPVYHAIVWQCARGQEICERLEAAGCAGAVKEKTGINLSPYFTAAKWAWLIENVPEATALNEAGDLCLGTMDSWLVYCLTNGKYFRTDYSNASRTQLFNIQTLQWDLELCKWFGVNPSCLAEVCDSDSLFGETTMMGVFDHPVPIHSVLGDSHGALFGQGCHDVGMTKSTYGTGSSIMMNIGPKMVLCKDVVTSLAWRIHGETTYVLEGNLNYTGAVITWLKDDLHLISASREVGELAKKAVEDDTYLVPAFSGLGAPYWAPDARAVICGMSRTTKRNEIVRAAEECIAYQITDVVRAMEHEAGIHLQELRVDGGPTRDSFLMQFQSDMLGCRVAVPDAEELSGIGAAYLAGISLGLFDREQLFSKMQYRQFQPSMPENLRKKKYDGWKHAVSMVLDA